MFRNVSLKCLTEIAGVSVSQYEEQFVTLFTLTMMQLKQVTLFVTYLLALPFHKIHFCRTYLGLCVYIHHRGLDRTNTVLQ